MDLAYPPELVELQRRARGLADLITAYEDRCEADNGLSAADHATIADAVRAARLNAINMPARWGGQGLGVLEQVVVQEQLGRLTNALWDTVWRPANALRACDDGQRARYLVPCVEGTKRDCFAVTEPDAGGDPRSIRTTARRTATGWVLDGEKWFVTVGDVADFLITLAMADGRPTLFLVDRDAPGVRLARVPRYMHTFVYEHPEFVLDGVEVGDDRVLGGVGQGYELTRDWFVEERLMIGARTVGAAERALEAAVEWATRRVQFGRPIAAYQLIQGMLADCAVDIATNRALLHQVAWEADRGLDRRTLHGKAALVKLAASEAAGRVVDRCVQIFGGRGYLREYPVERLYRELRVDRIWEGTSEIQRLTIANELVKRGTAGLLAFPHHPD
jgi:alkylation response protein AidB-like acyl-CoA dehydrogenase